MDSDGNVPKNKVTFNVRGNGKINNPIGVAEGKVEIGDTVGSVHIESRSTDDVRRLLRELLTSIDHAYEQQEVDAAERTIAMDAIRVTDQELRSGSRDKSKVRAAMKSLGKAVAKSSELATKAAYAIAAVKGVV